MEENKLETVDICFWDTTLSLQVDDFLPNDFEEVVI